MKSISVLLPVSAKTDTEDLKRAYRSITDQSIAPAEIVLVTNQSLSNEIESTIEQLVNTYSVSRHEHFAAAQGLGGVLQAGLNECSKNLVARMDADDIAEPERFAEQLSVLTETEADIVGSHLAEFRYEPKNPVRIRKVPTTHEEIAEWMAWRCPMNHPTTMFKRKPVLEVGGYRNFPLMEDWDLWARCLAGGLQFQNVDKTLVRATVDELTDRRGGLDYAKSEFRMAQMLRELRIASHFDTFQHLSLRIPPRLVPPQIRENIYQLFAR